MSDDRSPLDPALHRSNRKQINIRLPEETLRLAKAAAALEGVALWTWIAATIDKAVSR